MGFCFEGITRHAILLHMNDKILSTTASCLVNSALLAELVPELVELGVFSEEDTYDIYGQALEFLERMQTEAVDPHFCSACAEARRMIEEPLRTMPRQSEN